jgi:hypothetical protein
MAGHRDNHGGSDLSPWEELTLLPLAASVAAAVLTAATWHRLLGWLVEQGVLVPADRSPLVALPAGSGIGLDAPRLAITAAALVFAVVCMVAAVRRRTGEGQPR